MSSLAALRSRRAWLALLVLPALLLRALVPVGFMPIVSSGGISIGICPAAAAMPASGPGHMDVPAMLNGAHAHHHDGEAPSSPSHHAPCLFAASAGAAPLPSVLKLTAPPGTAVVIDSGGVSKVLLPTILRTQTSRGPPSLS